MPILKQEDPVFPTDLFEDLTEAPDSFSEDQAWWAVYTMSRQEKEFMRRLRPSGVAHYCPIIAKSYRSPQGRKRTSHIPLFANYVFILANEEQRVEALKTNCVSRCIPVHDQQQLFHDLKQLHQLISLDLPMTPEERVVPGEFVRVKTGPFAGAEGIVFQRRNQSRLLVQVDFLQAGASIELNDWDLEKII